MNGFFLILTCILEKSSIAAFKIEKTIQLVYIIIKTNKTIKLFKEFFFLSTKFGKKNLIFLFKYFFGFFQMFVFFVETREPLNIPSKKGLGV